MNHEITDISLTGTLDLEQLAFLEKELDWELVSMNLNILWDIDKLTKYKNHLTWDFFICNRNLDWRLSGFLEIAYEFGYLQKILDEIYEQPTLEDYLELKKKWCLKNYSFPRNIDFGASFLSTIQIHFLYGKIKWNVDFFIKEFQGLLAEYGPSEEFDDFDFSSYISFGSKNLFDIYCERLIASFDDYWNKMASSNDYLFKDIEDLGEFILGSSGWIEINIFYLTKMWETLSKNRTIQWSLELIENFSFNWCWNNLLVNTSITWTKKDIESFSAPINSYIQSIYKTSELEKSFSSIDHDAIHLIKSICLENNVNMEVFNFEKIDYENFADIDLDNSGKEQSEYNQVVEDIDRNYLNSYNDDLDSDQQGADFWNQF